MPGIDFEKRRRVIERADLDVATHVVRGTPHRRIRGIAETIGARMTVIGS